MSNLIIATCYFDNVPTRIIDLHAAVCNKLAPDATYHPIKTNSHAGAMWKLTNTIAAGQQDYPWKKVLWLDIDAIPLNAQAVSEPFNHADFWGCAQRANHIDNQAHIYASPFVMGITLNTYLAIGKPTFAETHRGDVGEELTYAYEATYHRQPFFLWPSSVEAEPAGGYWNLTPGKVFGLGTTYTLNGVPMYYHAFQIRNGESVNRFEHKCIEVLES